MISRGSRFADPQRVTVAGVTLALLLALWPATPLGMWLGTGLAAAIGLLAGFGLARDSLLPLLRPTPSSLALGTFTGALMAAVTHLVYPVAVQFVPAIEPAALALYARLDGPPGKLAALPIVLAVVVAEELVFRGLAYDQLRARFGPAVSVALAVALYTVPQLASGSWLLPLLAIGCGAIWTLLRHWTGGLVIPVLTHLVWDLAVMVAFPLTG